MIAVNLIPASRLRAGRRSRRVKGWSIVSAGVGIAVGLVAAAVRVASSAGVPDVAPSLAAAEQRTQDANTAAELLRRALAAERARLNANETAGKHPDWSVVLTLLARERGDTVVLSACELSPADAPSADKPGAKPPRGAGGQTPVADEAWTHTLVVEGFAFSALEAQKYCLRLEESGVFDAVTPPQASAGEYQGRPATRFRFECRFHDRRRGGSR